MKNIFFIVFFYLLSYCNNADAQYRQDVTGRPINEISYTDIDGDPCLVNTWTSGTVVLQNNKPVVMTLKFDTYGNRLLYRGEHGETMEVENRLTGFTLDSVATEISDIKPLVFVNNYPSIDKQTEKSWYQLIADGKVRLLKYYGNQALDSKAFNSATTTKSFFPFQQYYIYRNNQLIKIAINKKAILKILNEHADQPETYIKNNNINLKKDTDLQKLFNWYNSLK